METVARFFTPPAESFFLFGPRGTGKSTFVRERFPDSCYIDLFDTGVFRSLRPRGPLDIPQEMDGQALEGLVAQHLKAWLAYSREKNDLYFWRTRSGVEVDFVVYGPGGLWALEVKNTATIRPADMRGLKSFRDEYPESNAIFLYRGRERMLRNGIHCLPCGDFLIHLLPDKTIDDALLMEE